MPLKLPELRLSPGAKPWFHHPWRHWKRPAAAKRIGHFIYFGSDHWSALGSSDDTIQHWIAHSFPHVFRFPHGTLPFSEVREWMDERATDIWTMGYFHARFKDDNVFILEDDLAFEFRMRFSAKYMIMEEADEFINVMNLALRVAVHAKRAGIRVNG